jgi:transcriptional regulator with XRE-family HTH domain
MADSDEKEQYEQEFIDRVKAARIATGKKQWQVAELMGVKQDQYKHWESGRVMPHHLIGRFCLITNVDPNWLFTGRGAKPLRATHVIEPAAEPVPKAKRAKRSRAA